VAPISDDFIINRACAVEWVGYQESGADGPDSERRAGFWDGKSGYLGGCRRSMRRRRAERAQKGKGAEV